MAAALLDHPALRSNLITYIGNKRRLLPLIHEGIGRLVEQLGAVHTVADPFTGSGVVSRLARLMGYTVYASDIEDYTRPGGRASLECPDGWQTTAFAGVGGYRAVLAHLNNLPPLPPDRWYFARHYAPADTDRADPTAERMFFTHENALRFDAMLHAIHRELPLTSLERDVLLAEVLVLMSVHNNTSGVMKGFHHGWGGRGADALSRIMAPVTLSGFPALTGPTGTMQIGPAAEMLTQRSVDLVYLDPPYTIHQYGANYHLLTSAVRWDNYDPGPVVPGARAGIRTDHTRSTFCKRGGGVAERALAEVLAAADARALLVSYNNDGIIPPERLLEMLSDGGRAHVEILTREHPTFRGGKATQGALRTNEYLFVVIRGRTQSSSQLGAVATAVRARELQRTIARQRLSPLAWEAHGGTAIRLADDRWELSHPSGVRIFLNSELRVVSVAINLPHENEQQNVEQQHADQRAGIDALIAAAGIDMPETVETLVSLGAWNAALAALQRLKIKRYRRDFERLCAVIRETVAPDSAERTALERLYTRVMGTGVEDIRAEKGNQ